MKNTVANTIKNINTNNVIVMNNTISVLPSLSLSLYPYYGDIGVGGI